MEQETIKDKAITELLQKAQKEPLGLRKLELYDELSELLNNLSYELLREYQHQYWNSDRSK